MESVTATVNLICISLLLMLSGGRHMLTSAEGTDHFYPCYTMLNCDDSVDASYTESKETCMKDLELEKDVKTVVDMIKENEIYDLNTYEMEEIYDMYCELEQELQESLFNEVGAAFLDMISSETHRTFYEKICSDPMRSAECSRFNKHLDCYTALVDKMHEDGVC